MSDIKDTVLMLGGLTLGGLVLKEILFYKPNEEEQKLLIEVNEHIQKSIDESNLALEAAEDVDEYIIQLEGQDTITPEEWEHLHELVDIIKMHTQNSINEDEQALNKSKELSEMLGDKSYYEEVKEWVIEKGQEFIHQVAPLIITVASFIILFKGRHVLASLFIKRKGGGGSPETDTVVDVKPDDVTNPITRVPDNVSDEYNPIADPVPEEIYYYVPIDTPEPDLPPETLHETETLDKWKEIWLTVELLSDESKDLLHERLPSPMNEMVYYSWEQIPLAYGALFGGELISAASWHEVSRKGEFNRFAVACGLVLAAATTVVVLITLGYVTVSVGVLEAITTVIITLGAGVGAVAA